MNDIENRLSQALVLEKHFNPEKIRSVIKSDLFAVLKNYGDINSKDLDFDIYILEDGSYEIMLKAKLISMKVFKSF
ncbi:MAG: hypothetical protein ACI4T1_04930 [Christensenellales bacterium]